MAGRIEPPPDREDVPGAIETHVGAVGRTEYAARGVVVFVPASAPKPEGFDAARGALEAEGCTVTVEVLGATDRRGRWRVTVTHPKWWRGAGGSA
jgi:hypothetical protein